MHFPAGSSSGLSCWPRAAAEPWEQGRYPPAFLGTHGGLSACIPDSLCLGAGSQADSRAIQVQRKGQTHTQEIPAR